MADTGFERLLDMAGSDMALDLVTQLGADLSAVQDDLRAGFAARDSEGLWHAAHRLVGLAGIFGENALCTSARVLQDAAQQGDMDRAMGMDQAVSGALAAALVRLEARATTSLGHAP